MSVAENYRTTQAVLVIAIFFACSVWHFSISTGLLP